MSTTSSLLILGTQVNNIAFLSILGLATYCRILSKNSSPKVSRRIHYLVAIRIGMSKMTKGDEYLDYPDETLERMAKHWTANVRGVVR